MAELSWSSEIEDRRSVVVGWWWGKEAEGGRENKIYWLTPDVKIAMLLATKEIEF